jgi:beta-glucosidase
MNTRRFEIEYNEGLKVGYKWYDAENKQPLFAFGYGLSYTNYAYSDLKIVPGPTVTVTFNVKNTGARPGAEIAQVYASLPESAGEPPKRLVGWEKVQLAPGQVKKITLTLDPHYLSVFNPDKGGWELVEGDYKFRVGGSSRDLPLSQIVRMGG